MAKNTFAMYLINFLSLDFTVNLADILTIRIVLVLDSMIENRYKIYRRG